MLKKKEVKIESPEKEGRTSFDLGQATSKLFSLEKEIGYKKRELDKVLDDMENVKKLLAQEFGVVTKEKIEEIKGSLVLGIEKLSKELGMEYEELMKKIEERGGFNG